MATFVLVRTPAGKVKLKFPSATLDSLTGSRIRTQLFKAFPALSPDGILTYNGKEVTDSATGQSVGLTTGAVLNFDQGPVVTEFTPIQQQQAPSSSSPSSRSPEPNTVVSPDKIGLSPGGPSSSQHYEPAGSQVQPMSPLQNSASANPSAPRARLLQDEDVVTPLSPQPRRAASPRQRTASPHQALQKPRSSSPLTLGNQGTPMRTVAESPVNASSRSNSAVASTFSLTTTSSPPRQQSPSHQYWDGPRRSLPEIEREQQLVKQLVEEREARSRAKEDDFQRTMMELKSQAMEHSLQAAKLEDEIKERQILLESIVAAKREMASRLDYMGEEWETERDKDDKELKSLQKKLRTLDCEADMAREYKVETYRQKLLDQAAKEREMVTKRFKLQEEATWNEVKYRRWAHQIEELRKDEIQAQLTWQETEKHGTELEELRAQLGLTIDERVAAERMSPRPGMNRYGPLRNASPFRLAHTPPSQPAHPHVHQPPPQPLTAPPHTHIQQSHPIISPHPLSHPLTSPKELPMGFPDMPTAATTLTVTHDHPHPHPTLGHPQLGPPTPSSAPPSLAHPSSLTPMYPLEAMTTSPIVPPRTHAPPILQPPYPEPHPSSTTHTYTFPDTHTHHMDTHTHNHRTDTLREALMGSSQAHRPSPRSMSPAGPLFSPPSRAIRNPPPMTSTSAHTTSLVKHAQMNYRIDQSSPRRDPMISPHGIHQLGSPTFSAGLPGSSVGTSRHESPLQREQDANRCLAELGEHWNIPNLTFKKDGTCMVTIEGVALMLTSTNKSINVASTFMSPIPSNKSVKLRMYDFLLDQGMGRDASDNGIAVSNQGDSLFFSGVAEVNSSHGQNELIHIVARLLPLTAKWKNLIRDFMDRSLREPQPDSNLGLTVMSYYPGAGHESHGVVVISVEDRGAAKLAGIETGDVIYKINNMPVLSVFDWPSSQPNEVLSITMLPFGSSTPTVKEVHLSGR